MHDFQQANLRFKELIDFLSDDVCNGWHLDSQDAMDKLVSADTSVNPNDTALPLCICKLSDDELHHLSKSAAVTVLSGWAYVCSELSDRSFTEYL